MVIYASWHVHTLLNVCTDLVIPGDTEPDPDDSVGELSPELAVKKTGGATVEDKRCSKGGRGAATSRQEGHTSTQNEVQFDIVLLYAWYVCACKINVNF